MPEKSKVATYGSAWGTFFENLSAQGARFDVLLSPSNRYYAFLSKVDLIQETGRYDLFFELMNKEWADNAIFKRDVEIQKMAPTPPAVVYHMRAIDESEILSMLGLKTVDNLAEGSWYEIELEIGQTGRLFGDLYNPDIDTIPYRS